MHLKSVTLQGFKTFARRLDLPFGQGITAIVGPNGSGKSNLVDAVRWALGERNARGLRGHRMEDVIYAGGPGKSPVGMAEVTLTVDNADYRLPTDFTEIEITRRLYRSGESEYFINGARARLRDIDGLLASTGLRQDGYAVVAQNDIEYVIQATPAQRRELVEEAAGVRRLRDQREEACRRLDEAERDMQRARDLLAELQPRAEELRVQAGAADEYRAVETQLKALQGSLARDAWRKAKVQLRRAQSREQAARGRLDAAEAALAEFEPRYAARREELAAAREARFAHQQALADLRLRLSESEHQVRIVDERSEAVAGALRAARQELTRFAESARAGGRVIAELQREVEAATVAVEAAAAAAAVSRRQESESQLGLRQLEAERGETQHARQEAQRARLSAEYEIRQLEGRAVFLSEQHDQAVSAVTGWRHVHENLQAQASRLAGKLADADAELKGKLALVGELEARLTEAGETLVAREVAASAAAARVQALEAEVAALRLLRDRAQDRSPVQHAPDLRLRRLLEVIEVEDRHRRAVEAVLEGCLHGWVAAETQVAERAIALVAESSAGRETILTDPGAERSDSLPRQLRSVRGLVKAPPELSPLLSHLLGGVALVDDLSAARRLTAQHRDLQVVTLAGELVTPYSYRGGSSPDAPLQLQAQLREAEGGLGSAREQLHTARGRLEESIADQAALRQERAAAAAQLETIRTVHSQLVAAEAAARTQAQRDAQHGEQLQQQVARLFGLLQEVRARQVDSSERLRTAVATATALDDSLPELEAGVQAGVEALARAVHDRHAAELQAALTEQRHADLGRQLDRAAAVYQENGGELAQREAATVELENQPVLLQAERGRWERTAQELRDELTRIERTELPDAETLGGLEVHVHEDEQRNVALQVQRAQAQDAVEAAAADAATAAADVERCALALRDEDRPAEDDDEPLIEGDWQKTEREVSRLQRRLDAMGPVNLLAPQEYAQLHDRCDGLSTQLSDLESAAAQLTQLRRQLEAEIDSRFRTVFQAVAVNFQEFFQELFPGGRATLTLEGQEEAGPLDEGVEILAQTPGKRLQALTLLSGGERALTALAFLFALQAVNPSPFYVLDEVDAALDDANVVRFNRVLQRLAGGQQFVIVTHNHSTMAKAEVLYGVTLGDHGISRVVSVRLEEATTMPRLSERTA